MPSHEPFEIIYDTEVYNHLDEIECKYHSLIRRTIKQLLSYEPEVETINRKPLLRPSAFETAWELRFGPDNRFRVFYRTDSKMHQVYILAIGVKIKNILFIGGKEFKL